VPGLAPEPGSAAELLALRLARRTGPSRSICFGGGQFQRAGVPTVLCGPGRIDEAHQPDEFIELDQLSACIDFMRGLTRELST